MKKILFSFFAIIVILSLSGCDNSKETIKIKDAGFGTTTLKYDNYKDYVVTIEKGVKYNEATIKSEEDNFIIKIYHADMDEELYNDFKETRQEYSKGYNEYTWNGYEGYIYNGDKYGVKFLIKYKGAKVLTGDIKAYNNETANILDDFDSDIFQSLLNSIKFR